MTKDIGKVLSIVSVKLGRDWYARVDEDTGRIIHWGPWLSKWAADKLGEYLLLRFTREGRMAPKTAEPAKLSTTQEERID